MVAYSFKSFFAPQIEAGFKRQTIRADRRRHARPGEALQLFTGMRTRHCRKIRPDVTCLSIEPIDMLFVGGLMQSVFVSWSSEGDQRLSPTELEQLARDDGFAPEHFNDASGYCGATALENMEAFWREHHEAGPFHGVLIKW